MASSGFMWGYLVMLPVLIAQWVGVVGLRRAGKSGAWWSMATGTACSTIAPILSMLAMSLIFPRLSGSSTSVYGSISTLAIAFSGLSMLGGLLFAIGFAMHGLKATRAASRMQDLEQLTAAMSEEIEKLRQGGPAA